MRMSGGDEDEKAQEIGCLFDGVAAAAADGLLVLRRYDMPSHSRMASGSE